MLDGHDLKDIVLLDGKGCCIEDDCGGIYGLMDLIEDKNNEWEYDYDDFSIDEINNMFDKYYNKGKK